MLKKIIALFVIFMLVICVLIKIYFADKPVIDNIENCKIVKFVYYQPTKNTNTELTNQPEFDEKEVLSCLSHYKERRTLDSYTGGTFNKYQFEIYVDIGGTLKIIEVCDNSFSYFSYGSIKCKIINDEKLKEELLTIIGETSWKN